MRAALKFMVPALVCTALCGCAGDLDFDAIEQACDGDRFDIPIYDTYCGGVWYQGETFLPPGLSSETSFAVVERGVILAQAGIAYAGASGADNEWGVALGVAPFDGNGAPSQVSPGINREDLGHWALEHPIPTIITDIALVSSDPLAVITSAYSLGLVYAEWNGTDLVRRQTLPGLVSNDEQTTLMMPVGAGRTCQSGVCVVADGSHCVNHSDCGGNSYCLDGVCTSAPDCPDCGDAFSCSLTQGCRLNCVDDSTCPYPQACVNNVCGGRAACGLAGERCPSGTECTDGDRVCARPCTGDPGVCEPSGRRCLAVGESTVGASSVCGSDSNVARCSVDNDCHAGLALGLTVYSAESGSTVAIAEGLEGLRLGVVREGYGLTLAVKDQSVTACQLSGQAGVFCGETWLSADVVHHDSNLYVAMAGIDAGNVGIARVDAQRFAGEAVTPSTDVRFMRVDQPVTCPAESHQDLLPITEMHVVGDWIVSLERGGLVDVEDAGQTRLRIWEPQAGGDAFLREIGCLPIGESSWISFTPAAFDETLWFVGSGALFGGDRQWLGLWDVGRLEAGPAVLLAQRDIAIEGAAQGRGLPIFGDGRLFYGSDRGLTEFHVEVEP